MYKNEFSLSDIITSIGIIATIVSSHMLFFRGKKYDERKEEYFSLYFEYFKILFYNRGVPLETLLIDRRGDITSLLNKNFKFLDTELLKILNTITFHSPISINDEFKTNYYKLHVMLMSKAAILEKELELEKLSKEAMQYHQN